MEIKRSLKNTAIADVGYTITTRTVVPRKVDKIVEAPVQRGFLGDLPFGVLSTGGALLKSHGTVDQQVPGKNITREVPRWR